jgi:hypothetical protein
MSSALARIARCGVLWCCLLPFPAVAQYAVEPQSSVWLRALLDVRLVGGGPAPSWTDHGPGTLRYGGSSASGGFQRSTRLTLAQAAVQIGASLPWDVRGQVQVNIEPDIAAGYHPWLVEAFLRKEWSDGSQGWGLQSGVMNVPFSLENTGPAWSAQYTISASALNSWLWEDFNLAGAEGEWWHTTRSGLRLGALLGAGFGGDQIGRLLALRGWAIGDTIAGINGSLALPGQAGRTDIFNERDYRPTLYSWLSIGDEAQTATLKFGTIDNHGDESKPGVWHTRFNIVGLEFHPTAHVDLLAQYLDGAARVAAPSNSSAMSAYYVLLSEHFKQQRISLRYDSFRVHDLDGGPVSTSERGHALTLSYLLQIGLRNRIALEHVWMNSHRQDRLANPTPDGWQISYRFRY